MNLLENQATILIVEDDLDVAEMLAAYFTVQRYEVITISWGQEAVQACRAEPPDLVILDIRLPDIDGYEVARRLRSNHRTRDIPIIFLTDKRNRADRLQGLEIGADDYITKPFDIQELRLRVRNALRRVQHGALKNPVTGLPEGVLVDERLDECLQENHWALLLVSLLHLDAFSESFGFDASDDVLRAVGLMITNAVRELGSPSDFVGQTGPTDFVLVTSPDTLEGLSERIRTRVGQSLDYFYPLKDHGAEVEPVHRLEVHMAQLAGKDGPFVDLAQVKAALLSRRV